MNPSEYRSAIDYLLNGPVGIPSMPIVDGKRFACRCGVRVFTMRGDIFTCNGCGTEYEGTR